MDGRGDRETSTVNNIGPVAITTPGDRQIVITRLFDAPRALVFEAWTKAEHVARWWDPSGVPLAVCEIDLRPNGAFRWVNRAPDGGKDMRSAASIEKFPRLHGSFSAPVPSSLRRWSSRRRERRPG